MSFNIADHLGLTELIEPRKASASIANGDLLHVQGIIKNLKLFLFDKKDHRVEFETNFYIINKLSVGINISLPFLREHKLDQIHSQDLLRKADSKQTFPLLSKKKRSKRQLLPLMYRALTHPFEAFPAQATIILPYQNLSFELSTGDKPLSLVNSSHVFEIDTSVAKQLSYSPEWCIFKTIVDSSLKVTLFNFGAHSVELPINQVIGILTPLRRVSHARRTMPPKSPSEKWMSLLPTKQLTKSDSNKRSKFILKALGVDAVNQLQTVPQLANKVVRMFLTHWHILAHHSDILSDYEHSIDTPHDMTPINAPMSSLPDDLILDLRS